MTNTVDLELNKPEYKGGIYNSCRKEFHKISYQQDIMSEHRLSKFRFKLFTTYEICKETVNIVYNRILDFEGRCLVRSN